MAKKILYKIKAYHCPKCGSPTDPAKKYCDYCGRELKVRTDVRENPIRLLIDSGNFVYWDEILDIDIVPMSQSIECTTLSDSYSHFIQPSRINWDFKIVLPMTWRSIELRKLNYQGIHDIRFEYIKKGFEGAWECKSCIQNFQVETFGPDELGKCEISFTMLDEMKAFNSAIPIDVLEAARCPNCGSPLNNRFGACKYCSGWSEILW